VGDGEGGVSDNGRGVRKGGREGGEEGVHILGRKSVVCRTMGTG
jgi:hypothetical protein